MKIIFLFICSAMLALGHGTSEAGKLHLRFEGITSAGGTVRLALYDRKSDFMVEEKAVLHNFKADKQGSVTGSIENLGTGSYAIAVFLDENNNKKLDKNLVGVPTEPYGFSKEPPSKWRLPTWEEVKFDHAAATDQTIVVKLKKWALL